MQCVCGFLNAVELEPNQQLLMLHCFFYSSGPCQHRTGGIGAAFRCDWLHSVRVPEVLPISTANGCLLDPEVNYMVSEA